MTNHYEADPPKKCLPGMKHEWFQGAYKVFTCKLCKKVWQP